MTVLYLPSVASAKERPEPFLFSADGLFLHHGEADLEDGGSVSAPRRFVRAGAIYRATEVVSLGLFASRGWIGYEFGSLTAPWAAVNGLSVSAPLLISFPSGFTLFAAPTLRFDFEPGAERSSGRTYGASLGAGWDINGILTLGPAVGVFSDVASDDLDVFPALIIDWDLSERLTVSTGPKIGASNGPGLQVSFELSDEVSVGLAGRYESARFRLDANGLNSGGVGEDSSIPLVVSFDYAPTQGFDVSAIAGARIGGELRVEDSSGAPVDVQGYDPAPVIGAAIRFAF